LDFELAALVLGLACGAATVVLVLVSIDRAWDPNITWRNSGIDLAVIAAGFCTAPVLFFAGASGMDGPLFALLVTGSLLSTLKDRSAGSMSLRTVILLLAASLARPEGSILALYVAAMALWESRSIRPMGLYVAAVAGFLLLRYGYYGAWAPNTAHVKVASDFGVRLSNGFLYLASAAKAHLPMLAATVVVIFLAVQKRNNKETAALKLLSGWILVYLGYVLYVGGDNLPAYRFLLPVVPAFFLSIGSAWSAMMADVRWKARLPALTGLALALGASNFLAYRAVNKGYRGDMELAAAWRKVGLWLHENTAQDAVIATPVPGAMGYFSKRTTIDMLGLTDRVVATRGRIYASGAHGHARYHTDYIFDRNPDLVVYLSSGRFKEPVYASPEFIHRKSAYALYDFVIDPRCNERYAYVVEALADGTVLEMQRKRTSRPHEIAAAGP